MCAAGSDGNLKPASAQPGEPGLPEQTQRLLSLEAQLNDFAPEARAAALRQLIELAQATPEASGAPEASGGAIRLEPEQDVANLHCHTFFSFNAYGYSPTALAWLAKKSGFRLMGIVDFDVLEGVSEFLEACELLGVRGSAGMETRVFIPEFATLEFNSPGEPGVFYYMGIGFTSSQPPAEAAPVRDDLRQRAGRRNRLVIERVNALLSPVRIDYDRDVLPLTPSGNATERHILQAYLHAVRHSTPDPAAFWAEKLQMDPIQVAELLQDSPKFQNLVRARLMKRGGVGYVVPAPETFPTVQDVNRLVQACGALPCVPWLDGISAGEQAIRDLLDLLIPQGAAALNLIPDRSWNIADPAVKSMKLQKLYEIVRLAAEFDLPLNIGTEMNSYGQKLVDDFTAPELLPVRQAFLDGAHFIYGHTVMQRALGLGYGSSWAAAHFPGRRERNRFYTNLGYRTPPGRAGLERLKSAGAAAEPEVLLELFK